MKKEKKVTKEEIETERRGATIAAVAMVIVCFIYFILCITIQGETNYGWYSMIALYCTIVFGYKGIKLKKKLDNVTAVIWLLMFIITCMGYIGDLVHNSTII